MEAAALLAIEQFEREYESTACPVCQAGKWANYPFCRSCSIRLQRAHLMKKFDGMVRYLMNETTIPTDQERDWRQWPPWLLNDYWRHYDRCRDYLINTRSDRRYGTHERAD